jgi:hypothetical protein
MALIIFLMNKTNQHFKNQKPIKDEQYRILSEGGDLFIGGGWK